MGSLPDWVRVLERSQRERESARTREQIERFRREAAERTAALYERLLEALVLSTCWGS